MSHLRRREPRFQLPERLFSTFLAILMGVTILGLPVWLIWNLGFREVVLNGQVIRMAALPGLVIVSSTILIMLRTAVQVFCLMLVRRVVLRFEEGRFFEQGIVDTLRRLSGTLFFLAALELGGIVAVLWMINTLMSGPSVEWLWALAMNLPIIPLASALFVMAIAAGFQRAIKLAEDAELTV